MQFSLFVLVVAVVAFVANADGLNTNDEIYRWSQEIVTALNADTIQHAEILLHFDERSKIIVPNTDAPVYGDFKGVDGYFSFIESCLHNFNMTNKNFSVLDVSPLYSRALINASFKLVEKFSEVPRSTNWMGKMMIHFGSLGKIKHILVLDENQEQTNKDLFPKALLLLNDLEWAYFKTPSLTIQSDFWSLVDDNIVVKYKNLPSQLFNDSSLTGKQDILNRCQAWDRLIHPTSLAPDVRSLMEVMFHFKLKVETLFADESFVVSRISFGHFKMITKHTFLNNKLTAVTVIFEQMLKPWQILSPPLESFNNSQVQQSPLLQNPNQFGQNQFVQNTSQGQL